MTLKLLQRGYALAVFVLITAGCSGLAGEPSIVSTVPPPTAPQPIALPQTAPDLALGAQIYAQNCTRCHGVSGKGDGELVQSGQVAGVPDFTDPKTIQGATPADWYEIVTNGRLDKLMPPWGDKLSDDQRWSVTNYVYSLSAGGVAVAQAVSPPVATPEVAQATEAAVLPRQGTPEASAGTTVAVTGVVANQTAGGSLPANLALILHAISADGQSAHTFDASASADGGYRFENVPFEVGGQYVITASYEGAAFSSELITATSTDALQNIPLNIYEVTNDPSAVAVNGLLSMLQTKADNSLEVVQIFDFANTSDHAYLKQSDGSAFSSSVRLPTGAAYEDFSGGSYQISADGTQILDTQPVLPGASHVMHVAFVVPYSGSTDISQPLDFPLNGQLEVMTTGGMSVSGDGVTRLGTRQLGDRTFVSYGGQFTQQAGESLRYSVSGSDVVQGTTSGTTSSGVGVIAYLLIGAGLLAIGAAFGFFMRERKETNVILSPNMLMKQIADLDMRHENGEIDESSYQKQRSVLKARLVALMKEQARSSAD